MFCLLFMLFLIILRGHTAPGEMSEHGDSQKGGGGVAAERERLELAAVGLTDEQLARLREIFDQSDEDGSGEIDVGASPEQPAAGRSREAIGGGDARKNRGRVRVRGRRAEQCMPERRKRALAVHRKALILGLATGPQVHELRAAMKALGTEINHEVGSWMQARAARPGSRLMLPWC